MTLLRTRLTSRLSLRDVKEICLLAQGESNNAVKDELYRLSLDADHRVAVNALWVFTHFTKEENSWLYAKHDELIDRAMSETDVTKRRLLMTLLLCQPFGGGRGAHMLHRFLPQQDHGLIATLRHKGFSHKTRLRTNEILA